MDQSSLTLLVSGERLLSCRLWVIDDWAVVAMNREIAEEVFDLIDRRKYSAALVLTSNRDAMEWGEVFPNSVLANAPMGRLFEQAHIVVSKGKSYRLKGRITTRAVDKAIGNSLKPSSEPSWRHTTRRALSVASRGVAR